MSELADLHDELRAVARDLLASSPTWERLVEVGWPALEVPDGLDGSGATFAELAVVLEEQGRAAASTSLFGTAVLGVPALAGHELLGEVARGARIAVATTGFRLERGTVSGEASFVVDAAEADHLLLVTDDGVARVAPAAVARTAQPVLDATRSFSTVVADGAPVEDVWPIDPTHLRDRGALAVACDSLGVGQAMLDATVAYAKVRTQFDQPIGSFQAVKHQCADMLVQLTIGRALLDDAVASLDPVAASRAKAFLGQAAVDVAGTAMQLHGGIGYTWESDVHVFLKRAILDRVWFGTPAEHRGRVAAGIVRR